MTQPVAVPTNAIPQPRTIANIATQTTPDNVVAVEIAALKAWPAPIVERMGDWWLRSAEGFTGRGNSALTLGDPGLPLAEAIARVAAFYRRIGERPLADVPQPIASEVAEALAAAGWTPVSHVLIQTASLPALIGATPDGQAFELVDAPSSDHLDQIRASRSMLPPAAIHLLTGVQPVVFAECREGGVLVSRGRGTVTDGRLGLYSISTVPEARGRGLASALVGRLARWAYEQGATSAFLQVEATNDTAIRLYERLGFRMHHQYTRFAL